jgi:colicin import membrane protein
MGFWSRLFGKGKEPISDEVKQARERLGITIDEEEEKEERKRELAKDRKTGWEFESEDYDPWDELKNVRMNFWIGGWAAKRLHWRPNNDKLREELEEVARKREEKEAKQWEKAASDENLRRKLEEAARKREEKERKAREKQEALEAKLREKERRD